jgi:hypothetical protein
VGLEEVVVGGGGVAGGWGLAHAGVGLAHFRWRGFGVGELGLRMENGFGWMTRYRRRAIGVHIMFNASAWAAEADFGLCTR